MSVILTNRTMCDDDVMIPDDTDGSSDNDDVWYHC